MNEARHGAPEAEVERNRADPASDRRLLRTLLDALPDVVYTKDMAGRFVMCNRATLLLFGFDREQDLAGKNAFDLMPAEAARQVQVADARVLGGQSILDREECSVDRTGLPHWQLTTKVPLRDGCGQVNGYIGIHRNITERKRAQEVSRELGERLSNTLDGLTDGFCTLDQDWRITYVNHPAERMLKRARAVLLGQVVWDRLPELAGTAFESALRQAMEQNTIVHLVAHFAPLGRWYEVRVHPSRRGLKVYLRNVSRQCRLVAQLRTERARLAAAQAVCEARGLLLHASTTVEQALASSEQESRQLAARLTNMLESISDGFYTVDPAWRITYANRQAARMLGRPGEDLVGRLLWDEFPLMLKTEFERCYRRAVSENVAVTFQAFYPPCNTWFCANGYPSEEGLAVYLRDVSAERAAHQQLELLETSVSQLNDIVLITEGAPFDRAGPRILFVNDAFVRITGHAREDVLGKSPRLLQGPRTDRVELDRIGRALAHFEPVHAELVNYTKNGEPYWVAIDIVPVGLQGGRCSHFVAIERDITERKRDQDAFSALNAELEARVIARTAELNLARDEAEHANQAKSTFLATMSHEIRTPMNGVLGMIDVLQQTRLLGHQVEMVDLIRDSAFSLLGIIDDILDFSKIEAGSMSIHAEAMDAGAAVEKVCAMLDHSAVHQGVRMTVFVDPALPLSVLGDAMRLRQVLVNLIGNAIKFSAGRDEPGRVSVRAVLAERHAQAVTVDLTVSDNGIGMDSSALSRLFTPFSQADGSTTRRFGGTGLGLAISSMLVRLMGGEISVRSLPNQGSAFTVRLRFETVQGAADAIHPSLVTALRCRVVGSELPLADDLALSLSQAGAIVERCADMASAAAAVVAPGPCVWLILPGSNLPVLEDLRALASSRPDNETRFVVLAWGPLRQPRFEAADLLRIDADSLSRHGLLRALALAAGRLQQTCESEAAGLPMHAPTGTPVHTSIHTPIRTPIRTPMPMPMPKARTGPEPLALRSEPAQQDMAILVAEDNEINRQVIQYQLDRIGFSAELVANGREALQRWRAGKYALLLTDLHMPEMDGYALATAIRAEEIDGRRVPIIALSANVLRDEELRCRAAGMDAYLSKPVSLPRLKSVIEDWLGPGGAEPLTHGELDGEPDEARLAVPAAG